MFPTASRFLKFAFFFCIVAAQILVVRIYNVFAMANPASVNCIKQGGTLEIRRDSFGDEYGVCIFANNKMCEEWAMMSGECPVGGLDMSAYRTPAAQHCVFSGGKYQVTGDRNSDREQGTCTFKNGQVCDVWDYFIGNCNKFGLRHQKPYPLQAIGNPAFENCLKQGGTLEIRKSGDGADFDVCIFADNKMCGGGAMVRGECPVGGIDMSVYHTPSAQYCVFSGGKYQITNDSKSDGEHGTCTFKNGQVCDVWDYFIGNCNKNGKPL